MWCRRQWLEWCFYKPKQFTSQKMSKIASHLQDTKRRDLEPILSHSSQKEPILPPSWSQTSSSQNRKKINFCCWRHPVSYGGPSKLVHSSWDDKVLTLFIFTVPIFSSWNHYRLFCSIQRFNIYLLFYALNMCRF